ncbi:MAG: ABC transporter substrate-binding protein [Armatimonadota bacterium]
MRACRPLGLLAAIIIALVGCRHARQPAQLPLPQAGELEEEGGWPRAFVDDLGAEVRLLGPARRVVSLAPGFTETIFAIGAGDLLVGRTDFCDEPPAALEVPSVGGIVNPSLEMIVSLEPDLVLVIRGTPIDVIESLRRAGLPVIARDTHTLAEALAMVRDIGAYLGRQGPADALADGLQTRMDAVVAAARSRFARRPPPSVLLVTSLDPVFAAGPSSLVGDMIAAVGAVNAAAAPDARGAGLWPQLSLEAVVERDPDIIVLATEGHEGEPTRSAAPIAKLSGWRELSAVRRGQVWRIDPDLVSRSGPRVLDGLEQLASIVETWARESDADG